MCLAASPLTLEIEDERRQSAALNVISAALSLLHKQNVIYNILL